MSTERIEIPADPEVLASMMGAEQSDASAGKTTWEWSELWGCSKSKTLALIAKAKRAGVLRSGWRISTRVDTIGCKVPVYWFVRPKNSKRGKR